MGAVELEVGGGFEGGDFSAFVPFSLETGVSVKLSFWLLLGKHMWLELCLLYGATNDYQEILTRTALTYTHSVIQPSQIV